MSWGLAAILFPQEFDRKTLPAGLKLFIYIFTVDKQCGRNTSNVMIKKDSKEINYE